VIYPGSTPVGNATLVVANVLTCNKYSPISQACARVCRSRPLYLQLQMLALVVFAVLIDGHYRLAALVYVL
jgi:hypothetical protein